MQIKVDEISKLIRQRIEDYEKTTDLSEVGTVISVGDGIARIYGLEKVMAGELLSLPHDVRRGGVARRHGNRAGALHILVNNAGIGISGPLLERIKGVTPLRP